MTRNTYIRLIVLVLAIGILLVLVLKPVFWKPAEKDWTKNAKEYIRLDKTISENLGEGDYSMTVPLQREKFTAKLINGAAPDISELIQYLNSIDKVHLRQFEDEILVVIINDKSFTRSPVVLFVLEKLSPKKTLDQYIRALRSGSKTVKIIAMGRIMSLERLNEIKDRLREENDANTLELINRMEKYGRDFDQRAPEPVSR
jgi:hypothetical protein